LRHPRSAAHADARAPRDHHDRFAGRARETEVAAPLRRTASRVARSRPRLGDRGPEQAMTVSQVVPGVWRAGTRFVNWYIVDGGDAGLTIVDAGLPGYRDQLDTSLAHIGRRREDVRAVVLTH